MYLYELMMYSVNSSLLISSFIHLQIFGLDSNTGRIVWQSLLPNVEPFDREERSESDSRYSHLNMPLFVQRTTAHFPHQPVCTLLCRVKVSVCMLCRFKVSVYSLLCLVKVSVFTLLCPVKVSVCSLLCWLLDNVRVMIKSCYCEPTSAIDVIISDV